MSRFRKRNSLKFSLLLELGLQGVIIETYRVTGLNPTWERIGSLYPFPFPSPFTNNPPVGCHRRYEQLHHRDPLFSQSTLLLGSEFFLGRDEGLRFDGVTVVQITFEEEIYLSYHTTDLKTRPSVLDRDHTIL